MPRDSRTAAELEEQYGAFKQQRDALMERYPDKWVVFRGDRVMHICDTEDEAHTRAKGSSALVARLSEEVPIQIGEVSVQWAPATKGLFAKVVLKSSQLGPSPSFFFEYTPIPGCG
jgi:hypothetical protein